MHSMQMKMEVISSHTKLNMMHYKKGTYTILYITKIENIRQTPLNDQQHKHFMKILGLFYCIDFIYSFLENRLMASCRPFHTLHTQYNECSLIV